MKLDSVSNPTSLSILPEDPLPSGALSLPWMAGVIALAIAVTTLALYFVLRQTGQPVTQPALSQAERVQPEVAPHAQPQQIQTMVEQLAKRLEKDPGNGAGWQMLGKSYAVLGRFDESVKAYSHAVELLPADADLLADYADVKVMAQSGSFQGEPLRLIRKALEVDPSHPKALALAGTEAFKRGDFKEALRCWNKALESVPADSELAGSIRNAIADANKHREEAAASFRR